MFLAPRSSSSADDKTAWIPGCFADLLSTSEQVPRSIRIGYHARFVVWVASSRRSLARPQGIEASSRPWGSRKWKGQMDEMEHPKLEPSGRKSTFEWGGSVSANICSIAETAQIPHCCPIKSEWD